MSSIGSDLAAERTGPNRIGLGFRVMQACK